MAARFGPPGELNLPIGNSLGDHDAVAVVTYSRVRRIQGAHRERCSRRKIGIPVGICWRRVSQAGCRSTTGIRDAPELPNGQDIGAANVRVIEPRQFDSRAARASERAPVLGRSIAASDATSMAGGLAGSHAKAPAVRLGPFFCEFRSDELMPLICPTCQKVSLSGSVKASLPAVIGYFAWGCFRYFCWEGATRPPSPKMSFAAAAFARLSNCSPSTLALRPGYAGHASP